MLSHDHDGTSGEGAFAEPVDWVRFHLAALYKPEILETLLEKLGGLTGVFAFLHRVASGSTEVDWMSRRVARRLVDPGWRKRALQELVHCREHGVELLVRGSPAWPRLLVDLPQMPLLLFSRGQWRATDELAIGIVGTRRPSAYGIRQARRFARQLSTAGMTVVSGLARGIDAEAHRAALEVGGRTIAVLGSGLGRIYPHENGTLARTLLEQDRGLLVSEFPWNAAPRSHHFPQRNRIISGLSRGVLVIEAGERSGSLLTVDWTLKQGRSVFVLPGRVDQIQARGCLGLIQSGAHPVIDPYEIIEDLLEPGNPMVMRDGKENNPTCREDRPGRGHDPFLQKLLPLFEDRDTWHPDELCDQLGESPRVLFRELMRLEASGRLRRLVGGKYMLLD